MSNVNQAEPKSPSTNHWWKSFYDEVMQSVLEDQTTEQISRDVSVMIASGNLQPGEAVFDQCCGLGQHSIELAKQGYRVSGVDQSEQYIASASEAARQSGVDVRFIIGDASQTISPEPVELVVNWHSSFAYHTRDDENVRMLKAAFDSLKPGGRMILEFPNMIHLMANFKAEFTSLLKDGTKLTRRSEIDMRNETLRQVWEYRFADAAVRQHKSQLRIYLPSQLQNLLISAGFVNPRVHGRDLSTLDAEDERVIAVAEKR